MHYTMQEIDVLRWSAAKTGNEYHTWQRTALREKEWWKAYKDAEHREDPNIPGCVPASHTKSLLEEIGLSIEAVNARSADYGVAIAEYLSKKINYNQLAARMGPTTMGR